MMRLPMLEPVLPCRRPRFQTTKASAASSSTANRIHASVVGPLLPVAQKSPSWYSESSVMQTVSTFCMVTRTTTPMAERMAIGTQSMSHASTRVSHGVYCSGPAP